MQINKMIKLLSWLGITSTNSIGVLPLLQLVSGIPNDAVLVVKQDRFIALAKKIVCDQ